MQKVKSLLTLLSVFLTLFSYGQDSWSVQLPTIGTFSSPRVSDLNKDGISDIILGGGRLEFQSCDTAMFALDGKTGALLWNVSASDQIFGSAMFLDFNQDGIMDPILNGRSSELKAINGSQMAKYCGHLIRLNTTMED